jgi:O-antigen ligase
LKNKIYSYLFLALSFVIPIHDKLVPPIILLIGLNWLLEFNFSEKIRRIKNFRFKKIIFAPVLLYFVYLIGTFYSEQLKGSSGALFDLEVKLSLLLFPLFFSTIDLSVLGSGFYKKVLKLFVYGSLASSILLINKAIMNYFNTQDTSAFFYTNLSWMHHPSYLALFFTFAIAILLVWLITTENKNIFKRNLVIILIIHFELFIVLLSSKAGLLGLGLTFIVVVFIILLNDRRKIRIAIVLTLSVSVTLGILFSLFPASYSRFSEAKKSIEDSNIPDNQKTDGSTARLLVWECSAEIIKENFLFGVGTGDVKPELNKRYEEKNIQQAIKENLNAHNQYLQTFIAIGFIGFLLLIASLILPVLHGFQKRKTLLMVFIVLFSFHLLVESMLERQAGVVFFAFFSGLLILDNYSFSHKSNPELPEI